MTSRVFAACVAAAIGCATPPATHARTWLAPTASLGKGAYVHRFVLRDPVTHQPLPNARYRLFLPGQVIAGLPVELFAKDDDGGSDARDAWATGLAHKGEVLWKLGRQDEARDVFAQARKLEPKKRSWRKR